jgi:Ring finger domain
MAPWTDEQMIQLEQFVDRVLEEVEQAGGEGLPPATQLARRALAEGLELGGRSQTAISQKICQLIPRALLLPLLRSFGVPATPVQAHGESMSSDWTSTDDGEWDDSSSTESDERDCCHLCLGISGEEVRVGEDGRCPRCLAMGNHCSGCARQGIVTPIPPSWHSGDFCDQCTERIHALHWDEKEDDEEEVECPRVTISAEDLMEEGDYTGCSICMAGYRQGEEVAQLPCQGGHRFHPKCIGQWLAGPDSANKRCPNCREKVRH